MISATIPMYGSRVLFRGYGTYRYTRPIDAALAYTDSLVICDEAHLAPYLIDMLDQLADLDNTTRRQIVLPAGRHRPKVVAVTATGDPGSDRFDLDSEDYSNTIIGQRLQTPKPIKVVNKPTPTRTTTTIATHLVTETKTLLAEREASSACLIFVNRPDTARAVAVKLSAKPSRKALDNPAVVTLTGRMRDREADIARSAVLNRETGMLAVESPTPREQHLIVVATQTLEVGADLDADCMVTEACGVRALTQRLGRLNRLGVHYDPKGVYVHILPDKKETPNWPVYGTEPSSVLDRLQAAKGDNGLVDLSPGRLSEGVLGKPEELPGRTPCVSAALMNEWASTTIDTPGEAQVGPFFNGLDTETHSVHILWRAYMPPTGEQIWPIPNGRETIALPIWEAKQHLADVDTHRVRWVTPDSTAASVPTDGNGLDIEPGWTLMLHAGVGKHDQHGWNPEAQEPVVDMSILSHGLPLAETTFDTLYGRDNHPFDQTLLTTASGVGQDDEPVPASDQKAAVQDLLQVLQDKPPAGYGLGEWHQMIVALDANPRTGQNQVTHLRKHARRSRHVRSDIHDELSAEHPETISLSQHGNETGAFARDFARTLGIGNSCSRIVEISARYHDVGKADPRFQEWLRGSEPLQGGHLLAKSTTPYWLWEQQRISAGWPKGGRHEVLSSRLIGAWLAKRSDTFSAEQAELLVHLIASHHGRGRPLTLPVHDRTHPGLLTTAISNLSVEACTDQSTVDWEQPRRFAQLNEHYGYWGLALLETIVRQADWRASQVGEIA